MIDLSTLPYIQAAPNTFAPGHGRVVQQIILHTSDAPKCHGSARSVANYFAGGSEGRSASAHFSIDADSAIHCVQLADVAYGAPGANQNGVHIEHAGNENETAQDWNDAYNLQMLHLSARVTAALCARYDIPARWLTFDEVAAHQRGITGHRQVTQAYPMLHGTHDDPGVNFPSSLYLSIVQAELAKG